MYSLNLDFIFNKVYDLMLGIKYVTLFVIFRKDPEVYLKDVAYREWDGLRDRGWLDSLMEEKSLDELDTRSFWEKVANALGKDLPDSDGDGIPDVRDRSPYDAGNLTASQLKELYEPHYSFWDRTLDFFGFGPYDQDGDGIPNSYEVFLGIDKLDVDTDHDGVLDGRELARRLDPLSNDSDGDFILDGRDEFPLEIEKSYRGTDSDSDGVSDDNEVFLGSSPKKKDTDGDGINDGYDTYLLDSTNMGDYKLPDLGRDLDQYSLSIQNPVLRFVGDMLSVTAIFGLFFLAFVILKFVGVWRASIRGYEEHFSHGAHHKEEVVVHIKEEIVAPGIAIKEHIDPPKKEEFKKHPRWAIIEGYMSAPDEALWRIGILEADMMLRDTLMEKGYQGDDVGELLKQANFQTIDLAWDAHKVRNRIAHEGSTYLLTGHEARRVFTLFEAVFRDLKIL